MQLQVDVLIQEITTVRDKMVPITVLHDIRKRYPDVDIHTPLMTISSAFRRFVLDSLAKLGEDLHYELSLYYHLCMFTYYNYIFYVL